MLVMNSGRVVEGMISQGAGAYVVDFPQGSMLIPYEQVRFEAANKGDAYRKMRRTMPDLTASNHINLARWCIDNHQYQSARTELLDALAMEPQRRDARDMLARLERMLIQDDAPRLAQPVSVLDQDKFSQQEVQALAGLSREAADRFVLRIHPLLTNKCGNTHCHGPHGKSDFQLRPRTGSSRTIAEQNLAQIFKYIDVDRPDASPLLKKPLGNHGRAGRAIFFGRSGQKQIEDIRAWVQTVTAERRAKAPQVARTDGRPSGEYRPGENPRQLRTDSSIATADRQQSGNLRAWSNNLKNSGSPSQGRGRALIEEVLSEQADPFNPQAFNTGVDLADPAEIQTQTGTRQPNAVGQPARTERSSLGGPTRPASRRGGFPRGGASPQEPKRPAAKVNPTAGTPRPIPSSYPYPTFPRN